MTGTFSNAFLRFQLPLKLRLTKVLGGKFFSERLLNIELDELHESFSDDQACGAPVKI